MKCAIALFLTTICSSESMAKMRARELCFVCFIFLKDIDSYEKLWAAGDELIAIFIILQNQHD